MDTSLLALRNSLKLQKTFYVQLKVSVKDLRCAAQHLSKKQCTPETTAGLNGPSIDNQTREELGALKSAISQRDELIRDLSDRITALESEVKLVKDTTSSGQLPLLVKY